MVHSMDKITFKYKTRAEVDGSLKWTKLALSRVPDTTWVESFKKFTQSFGKLEYFIIVQYFCQYSEMV
jgi:hypothetical protein